MDMSHQVLFLEFYGDRDGNLSMLKGRLQVLKQVPCDPPRKFFIIGVPRLHLVQFKHNNFFLSSSFQGGANARPPPPPPPLKKTLVGFGLMNHPGTLVYATLVT